MEINITLILQIMQFACAYYFLSRFLFTPAYKQLHENDYIRHLLYKNLEKEQHIKDILLQDFHIKKKTLKNILLESIPKKTTQSVYQKSTFDSALYTFNQVEFLQEDAAKIENFLVHHLSQVVKK